MNGWHREEGRDLGTWHDDTLLGSSANFDM